MVNTVFHLTHQNTLHDNIFMRLGVKLICVEFTPYKIASMPVHTPISGDFLLDDFLFDDCLFDDIAPANGSATITVGVQA